MSTSWGENVWPPNFRVFLSVIYIVRSSTYHHIFVKKVNLWAVVKTFINFSS